MHAGGELKDDSNSVSNECPLAVSRRHPLAFRRCPLPRKQTSLRATHRSALRQRATFAVQPYWALLDEGLRVSKRGTGYGQAAGLHGSVLLKCWAVTSTQRSVSADWASRLLSSLAAGRQSIRAELMYIKANAVNLISGIDRVRY
jgi:hypothetical protein